MAQATLLLNEVVTATANAGGAATFTFRSPPLGTTWQGSLSIPTAPPSAQFTAALASTVWGSWAGISPFGPLQSINGQDVTIAATGLVPGANYNAYFLGISSLTPLAPPTGPLANASVTSGVTGQVLLGTGSVTLGSPTSFHITIQPTWRSIYVAGQLALQVSNVIGDQSGIHYNAFQPPYFIDGMMLRYAMVDGVDTSVTVFVGSSAGTAKYWYGADLADIDEAVYPDSGLAFVVGNQFNGSGQTMPLDVVSYGGLQSANDLAVLPTSTANILAAPTIGQAYRLHSWSTNGTTSLTYSAAVVLQDHTTGATLGQMFQSLSDQLNGQLCAHAVDVDNTSSQAISAWVNYDVVNLPHLLNF